MPRLLPAFVAGASLVALAPWAVESATWHIAPDGTGDAPTIQAGIDSSSTGDVVELADGVYVGVGNRDINYHGKAITVRSASDDPSACIIDCEYLGRAALFETEEPREAVLQGVTLTHGSGVPAFPVVECKGTSPTIRNCRFVDNDALALRYRDWPPEPVGAQVWVESCVFARNAGAVSGSSPWARFVDCRFEENHGSVFINADNTRFEGCTFVRNLADADGGAARVTGYNIVFASCEFVGNVARGNGGAVSAYSRRDLLVVFEDCLFLGNSAGDAGGALDVSKEERDVRLVQITSGVFAGNLAGNDGGGLHFVSGTSAEMSSCTVASNWAGQLGGGLLLERDAHLVARNTVFWANCARVLGSDLLALSSSSCDFSCSAVDPARHDTVGGTISYAADVVYSDPMFCDPSGCSEAPTPAGVYTVASASPCLPANNACGELMGYFGSGCTSTSIESVSWAQIKAQYR